MRRGFVLTLRVFIDSSSNGWCKLPSWNRRGGPSQDGRRGGRQIQKISAWFIFGERNQNDLEWTGTPFTSLPPRPFGPPLLFQEGSLFTRLPDRSYLR
jgi:hypothetical protein